MAEPEQNADAPSADEAPKPARTAPASRVVPVLLTVNTVAILGVMALQVFQLVHPPAPRAATRVEDRAPAGERHEAPAKERKTEAKDGQPGPTLRLADFIVHLRDPDTDRYARMSFEMELPDEKSKEAVNARVPQIRDAFLAYLSDRTTEELRGSEAIARIKGALTQRLTDLAPSAGVRALYITELVVQ